MDSSLYKEAYSVLVSQSLICIFVTVHEKTGLNRIMQFLGKQQFSLEMCKMADFHQLDAMNSLPMNSL